MFKLKIDFCLQLISFIFLLLSCSLGKNHNAKWQELVNGTTENWRSLNSVDFPKEGWIIKDKNLTLLPGKKGGDLITKEQFEDFELELDYNIDKKSNTGIKYFVELIHKKNGFSAMGHEFQIIDDINYPTEKTHNDPKLLTGSLYLLYAANKQKILHPAGKWNHIRIVSKNGIVEHWLNGKRIVQYDRKSKEYFDLISETKYKGTPGFAKVQKGHILIQDYGDGAMFKNIRIRKL